MFFFLPTKSTKIGILQKIIMNPLYIDIYSVENPDSLAIKALFKLPFGTVKCSRNFKSRLNTLYP